MAKTKFRSTKRFGTRYGRTLRERAGKIESIQRQKHICPYCSKPKVKRISVGIWHCAKCDSTFTGRAYSPESRKVQVKTGTAITEAEEIQEEEDG